MRRKLKNANNSSKLPLLAPFAILTALMLLLFFLMKDSVPLDIYFLEDTSLSAVESENFIYLRDSVCENIFARNTENNNSIHIIYADEVNTMGGWTENRKCPLDKPSDLSKRRGTNPQKILERTLKEVKSRVEKKTKPVILLSIHADEQHDSSSSREDLLKSINNLVQEIHSKKGKMVFFMNSYNNLRSNIESGIANQSIITYCPYEKISSSQHPCSANAILKHSF
jgi:hypothetical protein